MMKIETSCYKQTAPCLSRRDQFQRQHFGTHCDPFCQTKMSILGVWEVGLVLRQQPASHVFCQSCECPLWDQLVTGNWTCKSRVKTILASLAELEVVLSASNSLLHSFLGNESTALNSDCFLKLFRSHSTNFDYLYFLRFAQFL